MPDSFVKSRRRCVAALWIALALGAFATHAQDLPDALAPAPGFTPVLTVTDGITESLKTTMESGVPFREVVTKGTTKVSITANITGIVLADIDETTEFAISIGDLTVSGALGDAPAYTKGKTTAFIPFNTDDNGAAKGTNGVKLSWTAKRLTVGITRALGDDTDPGSVVASQLAGQADPKVRDSVSATLQFGNISSAARPVLIQGTCSVKTQIVGTAPDTEEYFLNTVSLTGSGDFVAPTVTISVPKANAILGADATVTGKAKDSVNLATVEYATNPDADVWTDVPFTLVPPLPPDPGWGPTTAEWTFDLTDRPVGTSVVWVRATDLSGNISKPAMVKFINPMPALLTGRWDALLAPAAVDGMHGAITFTCDAKGGLSGKLFREGTPGSLPFTGTWLGTNVQAIIKSRGKPDITLTAVVNGLDQAIAADALLEGQLQVAGTTDPAATLTAFRSHWSTKVPLPAPLVGRCHYFVGDSDVAPVLGHGYVVLVLAKAGTVTGSGKLADGSTVTFGGVLGSGGQVPLYVPLYTSKGSLSVLSVIAVDTGLPAGTTATWRRPAAFTDKQFPAGYTLDLAMSATRYSPPGAGVRVLGLTDGAAKATATWEGDAVAPAQSHDFTVSATNKATPDLPNPSGLKVNIATVTGIITGDFKLPATTILAKYEALIVGGVARGFYIAPAPTGVPAKRFGSFQVAPAQ